MVTVSIIIWSNVLFCKVCSSLGHYSLIISFSSCRLPEQDAGGRILPLHHYCVNIIKIN